MDPRNRQRVASLFRGLPDPRNCRDLAQLQSALLAVYEVLGQLAGDRDTDTEPQIEGRNGVTATKLAPFRWLVEGEPGAPKPAPGPPWPPGLDGADDADGTDGNDGTDGREVELQATEVSTGVHRIEWRYVGDAAWTFLCDVTDGTDGDDGRDVELRASDSGTGQHLVEWRYVGEPDAAWRTLATILDGAKGDQGDPGPNVPHNDLEGLQGGTETERYHLTKDEYDELLPGGGAGSEDDPWTCGHPGNDLDDPDLPGDDFTDEHPGNDIPDDHPGNQPSLPSTDDCDTPDE